VHAAGRDALRALEVLSGKIDLRLRSHDCIEVSMGGVRLAIFAILKRAFFPHSALK
jgi:hypothetical protein